MNVLEVQGLTKRYPAFTLNGVSFDVPQGAVMGFIGRNGAGKSNTLKSILGMVHPDAGAVRVFGMDYAENERAIRRELGVVLGGIDFYPKKKIKTITDVTRRFYNNWDEEKYRHYLELFHIDESKRVDQLSSGMKVKYMIALALSHNARLLILDEPTSGLDPVVRDEILTIFADFTRDEAHAVLISSHIVSDLEKICDYIAFLHKGRLLLCEEKDRLTEEYGILRGGTDGIAPAAVCGRHATPYGTEYLVRRDAVPVGMALGQVNIEDLFVFMAKEA